ncbi:MAG: PAS domain-containing hybrid sensor histidine kinase/response regulator [Candidatus Kariarchaeaceae archaeon]
MGNRVPSSEKEKHHSRELEDLPELANKIKLLENEVIELKAHYRDELAKREQVEQEMAMVLERNTWFTHGTYEGILIHVDGVIKEINSTLPKLFQYSGEDMIGKKVFDFIHKDSIELARTNIIQNYTQPYEISIIQKDGSLKEVEVIGSEIEYRNQKARIASLRDISDRKNVERDLLRSQELYRSLVENSPNRIIRLDLKGSINYINYVRHHDSPEAVIGDSIYNYVKPSYVETFKKELKLAIETNSITRCEIIAYYDRFELVQFIPMMQDDQVHEILMTSVDITDLKKAEALLKESEERYRIIFDSALFGVVLFQHNRIVFINQTARKMFGYGTTAEMIEMHASKFLISEDITRILDLEFRRMQGEDVPSSYGSIGVRKDGSHFPIQIAAVRMNFFGEPAIQVYVEDITEKKLGEEKNIRLQAQVERAQKLESLGVLAGGIAHDFNNLLMGILGNASLAVLELPEEHPATALIQEVEKIAQRASDLSQQMLAYSGKGKFEIKPMNLSSLIENMQNLLEVSISKNTMLEYQLDQKLPPVDIDSTQMQQVVHNLVTNASEASKGKADRIIVSTGVLNATTEYLTEIFYQSSTKPQPYVFVEVTDNGIGLDQNELMQIFDPFYSTKFTGRGLGLAVVMGIVRGHSGAIDVKSTVGLGSRFRILLPCSSLPIQITERQMHSIEWSGEGTILVCDDEESILEVSKKMIQRLGFDVILASNGQEAVSKFKQFQNKIVAIVMDLTMPYMDGIQAYTEISAVDASIPVILSSGYNEQELTSQFSNLGFAAIIQKPFTFQDLSKKLFETLIKV